MNCPVCEQLYEKIVDVEPGETCPECGHWSTCTATPACDESCEFYLDAYNTDGDCLMLK